MKREVQFFLQIIDVLYFVVLDVLVAICFFFLRNNMRFLSYCYIASLRNLWTFLSKCQYYVSLTLVVISGECNRVEPLRIDLANGKLHSSNLTVLVCLFKCGCRMRIYIFFTSVLLTSKVSGKLFVPSK